MRKLMMLLAMLAMMLLAAVPAVAQEYDQDAESGDLEQDGSVSQSGDNSNQCVGQQLVGNTGNAQTTLIFDEGQQDAEEESIEDVEDVLDFDLFDEESVLDEDQQDDLFDVLIDSFLDTDGDGADDSGDVFLEDVGSTIEVSPYNTTTCDQSVYQTAEAYGTVY